MSGPRRVVLLLVLLLLACGLNLALTRWGADRPEVPILTISTDWSLPTGMEDAGRIGLYAAPFLDSSPWIALSFGLVLPLMLLGVISYVLVRPQKASSES